MPAASAPDDLLAEVQVTRRFTSLPRPDPLLEGVRERIDALFGEQRPRLRLFAGSQEGGDLLNARGIVLDRDDPLLGIAADQMPAQAHLNAAVGQTGPAQRAFRVPLNMRLRLRKLLLPLSIAGIDLRVG